MNETTVIPVGAASVELLDEGDAIVRMTNNGKIWEGETRGCWAALVKPDHIMIDVGAYTGIYSIASAMMGMKVLAFEPHPANFARLKLNAAINSVRIKTVRSALSNMKGSGYLKIKRTDDVISDTATLEHNPNAEGIHITTNKMDDIKFTKRVSLIKIDVEEHEGAVLSGARFTIHDHKPLVIVECLTPYACMHVDSMMQLYGYRQEAVLDRRNRLYKPKRV